MISPRIDKLLENVDSNYASVVVAAKRARQINSYYHNLGEGTFDEFPPPMVETGSKNYLTIALEAFFKSGALLKDFAGAILIGPEVGFGNLLLQFIELALLRAGVKETSGRPRCEFSVG